MTQPASTRIMGIVNVTPDSFSDGGLYSDAKAAIAHMQRLVAAGAEILDIGAESTRPGAVALSSDEEWARLAPVLELAKKQFPDAIISIDTRHAATAAKAIAAGADWINDVADAADPDMLDVVAAAPCRYVLMHSLSVPADPKLVLPAGVDATAVVADWAKQRLQQLSDKGIDAKRVVLDPGIGFGKTAEQSWNLLRGVPQLMQLGVDLLIGHSRKSFFKALGEREPAERDVETQMVSAWLAAQGVPYLRVHDVAGTKRAIGVGKQLQERERNE